MGQPHLLAGSQAPTTFGSWFEGIPAGAPGRNSAWDLSGWFARKHGPSSGGLGGPSLRLQWDKFLSPDREFDDLNEAC